MKILITGITGQTGSYLAEQLLEQGHEVHGTIRRSSYPNTERIDHIFHKLQLHYCDITSFDAMFKLLSQKFDYVFNLACQSHVKVSYDEPIYSFNCSAALMNILEAIKILGIDTGIYQASSSEMFGTINKPANEETPFNPQSPYAAGKVAAYYLAKTYRNLGLDVKTGILFNHESERRGINFVTRKITTAFARSKLGLISHLDLGNINSVRDWGYAPEYAKAIADIMFKGKEFSYCVGTEQSYSVRNFIDIVRNISQTDLEICINPKYLRPNDVECLKCNCSKFANEFGWKPNTGLETIAQVMYEYDLKLVNSK